MNDIAVQVRGLGKKYRIGAIEEGRRTLRETLMDALATPFRKAGSLLSGNASGAAGMEEEIWALKDVAFDVPRGQVLGIIGKNGAGKSTLLKVLSRITEPTEGVIEIHGRVGSLLEVGTGFHPELTGRENVYLNGAILGMGRTEIDRKFDEIVAFAEVERFLDTPVKYYSSGMYVRLAFAVAAHLEPEILVVDEVLSVGDAAFQQKCLGKMGDVAQSGRTVLFVSHNMGAVTDLCDRAILLEGGQVTMDDGPTDVVSHYLTSGGETSAVWQRPETEEEPPEASIQSVRILSARGRPESVIRFDEDFDVEIEYEIRESTRDLVIVAGLWSYRGFLWQSWDTDTTGLRGTVREPGSYVSRCRVPAGLVRPGRYSVTVVAHVPNVQVVDSWHHLLTFDVSQVGFGFESDRAGSITPVLEWEVTRQGRSAEALESTAS
jgi:lipopolysaccharide transport system ATP-binding protein